MSCIDLNDGNTRKRNCIDLCVLAHEIRKSDIWNHLDPSGSGPCRARERVRHYIGRLDSWRRAARYVINTAAGPSSPQAPLITAAVSATPSQPTLRGQDAIDVDPDIDGLVLTVCPRYRSDEIRPAVVKKLNNAKSLHKRFVDVRQIPIVHAEAAMAYYFWANSKTFADGELAIGCSKPSCFCCDMYLRILFDGRLLRPTHGNAWFAWYPPSSPVAGYKRHDARTVDIVNRMGSEIQSNVEKCIDKGIFGRDRMHDSTTGTTGTSDS